MHHRLRTSFVFGAGLLGLAGCFFEPRTPESGSGEVCFESVAPKEFQQVFANLDGSLACLQQTSYEDQLAEVFVFVPDPAAQAEYPTVFADEFDLEAERAFLGQLFSVATDMSSELRVPDTGTVSGNDPVVVEATYRVVLTSSGSDTVYEGEARYTLEQIATNWVLTRWEDIGATGGSRSISDLRGSLLQ